ncbi:hypothetical protein JCM6292_1203 [Bacteroides pyogenes JCM 6292]|uniref:Uncharacterized protein n=1 Tax=Bacteroides pyogenes JCM 6292 TaxID=1235809 RepID=W4P5J3_9BACE|nr:hypothetical protein JCM6292_1203 [Bacteroides pyogenes JCM 6292]
MTFWRFQKPSFEDVLLASTFVNSLIYRNKKTHKTPLRASPYRRIEEKVRINAFFGIASPASLEKDV